MLLKSTEILATIPISNLYKNAKYEKQAYIILGNIASGKSTFAKSIDLYEYSRGMGAIGLPGDLSSQSRFVRASFVKLNSVSKDNTDTAIINQFFHILGSVEQIRGCVMMADGRYEITVYASCCDTEKGIYYYKTYENGNI